jgi:hypothetical protein
MAQPKPRASASGASVLARAKRAAPPPETPADVIARGWISALEQLDPARPEAARDPHAQLAAADHWTVEILIKLGFAAPDCAYEVGVRIVELTDNAWLLRNVAIGVFEPLLRREPLRFSRRLAADAERLPRLAACIATLPAPAARRAGG